MQYNLWILIKGRLYWRADFDTVVKVVFSLTFLPFIHTDHGVAIFKSNKWKFFHLQGCSGRQKMLRNLGSKNAFCLICHASYRNFISLEAVDLHLMMAHKWPKPGNQERKDYYQFLFRYRPVEHMGICPNQILASTLTLFLYAQ